VPAGGWQPLQRRRPRPLCLRRRHRRPFVTLTILLLSLLLASCGENASDRDTAGQTGSEAPAAEETPEERIVDALEPLLAEQPLEVRSAIKSDPQGFVNAASSVLDSRWLTWVLVDKEYGLSADYVPGDLVYLADYADPLVVNREGMQLERETAEALAEMAEAASSEGIVLDASSAYRSYDYQAGLFQRYVDQMGAEEAARVSARPGHSQHQLGTAVDFGSITLAFGATPAGKWLAEEAWRFGFSLSYPEGAEEITGYSYEPWHFRYLGRDATRLERVYFAGMQQWMLSFLHQHGEELLALRGELIDKNNE
jgi:D-alanyl-D-alanine carboxypeptidase